MLNQNLKLKDRAYQYSIKTIEFLNILPQDTTILIISRQLLRYATSVGANIIEAQAASSRRDFTNFFNHSLKSANESSYWLGLLKDAKKIDTPQINYLINETKQLANILGASILTLKGKNKF